jgi:23S rRNA pseudouridine1911/1915/1917 synthase
MAGPPADREPTVAEAVRAQAGVSWSRAKKLVADGRVSVDGEKCLDPAARVHPHAVIAIDARGPGPRAGALAESAVVFHDRDVVVVDKPAGMLSVADEPGNKDTLALHLRTLLRRIGAGDSALGVVHRLDRETSGVMAFARNATAQRALAAQFRAHDIERVYHAIVHGAVERPERIESDLVPDRGDGLRGSHGHYRRARGDPPPDARHAVTNVTPLEALRGATLVECRLETGRQHQIRIHLSELGHPLVGERVYIRDYTDPKIAADRVMLHARSLGFVHPRSGRKVSFEREPPADFLATLTDLRRGA